MKINLNGTDYNIIRYHSYFWIIKFRDQYISGYGWFENGNTEIAYYRSGIITNFKFRL